MSKSLHSDEVVLSSLASCHCRRAGAYCYYCNLRVAVVDAAGVVADDAGAAYVDSK